jgi:hypothetical protein
MSRIGHAKTLTRLIIAELDRMDATEAAEIKRVCNLAMPLVIAIEAGYVSQVTEDGLAELVHLADVLLTDEWKSYRALAARAEVGTELEVTRFATRERVVVRITKVPASRTWGFPAVFVTGPQAGEPTTASLFWGGQQKPIEV